MNDRFTHYHEDTPQKVQDILESYRVHRYEGRLTIWYGDVKTGKPWGDIEEGYIGRSTGTKPIPLTIHNQRSMGGLAILDHCIVRIDTAHGKRTLYILPDTPTLKPKRCPSCKYANVITQYCAACNYEVHREN